MLFSRSESIALCPLVLHLRLTQPTLSQTKMFQSTAEDKARACNSVDVTSLSNPTTGGRCTHLDLDVELSFDTKTISGTATYDVEVRLWERIGWEG